ncbi:hypothetical protein VCHA43P277_40135 [Vibrio chagasii]|nr:hypothetical protein VCHA43P277_40135 [Vibrio chagasii]
MNAGEWIIHFFLLVMFHLVSDCTHLILCLKLMVQISSVFGIVNLNKTNMLNNIWWFEVSIDI